jgi:hypothetical protein
MGTSAIMGQSFLQKRIRWKVSQCYLSWQHWQCHNRGLIRESTPLEKTNLYKACVAMQFVYLIHISRCVAIYGFYFPTLDDQFIVHHLIRFIIFGNKILGGTLQVWYHKQSPNMGPNSTTLRAYIGSLSKFETNQMR